MTTAEIVFEQTREGTLRWEDITQSERDHWIRAVEQMVGKGVLTHKKEPTRDEDFKALHETAEAMSVLRRLERGGWYSLAMSDLKRELEGRMFDISSRVTTNA